MQTLFVGHRGTGKTTVARFVAEELGEPFVDLDEAILAREGRTSAELVAEDEPRFRALEIEALTRALAEHDDAVISAGAGLQQMPEQPLIVWLWRDGWESTAQQHRDPLRPDLDWDAEVAWMREEREPRWRDAAHLHYRIPRGRSAERAARDIATMLRMIDDLGPLAKRTWSTPSTPQDLTRAIADVKRFGLAGVEIRSDVFSTWPRVDVPTLAALRTPAAEWLAGALAEADWLDIDAPGIEFFADHGGFDSEPRPLVLSTHPGIVDPDDLNDLVQAGRSIQQNHASWAKHLVLKYAPEATGTEEVGLARAIMAPLASTGVQVTFLPQGRDNAWFRPLLAPANATNYVAPGLRPSRFGDSTEKTPWDLQDWLPNLTGPVPQGFDVLVGAAPHTSQGDLWHRRAALTRDESFGYVKVPVHPKDIEAALHFLRSLRIRGVSVTSPFKPAIAFVRTSDAAFGPRLTPDEALNARKAEFPIAIGNTLVWSPDKWLATDTDAAGMSAVLDHLEAMEIGPATIAIFGQGGVSPALIRAIDQSDWFLVHHASAREGWTEERPAFVTVVVNAGGPNGSAHEDPPRCRAWVDLHYVDVAEPPDGVLHLNGDLFFDAQAEAQREFWNDLFEGE